MKNFLFISLAVGILLVIGLITYGAYLNKAGEQQISKRIENHRIPVRVAKVERRDISANIRFPTLKLYSDKMVDAVAMSGGRIKEIFVKKNDFVQEGQVLCTVIDDEMPMKVRQAEISIKDAESQLKSAKKDFERQQRLWDNNATALSSVDEAETKYNTTIAKLEDAKAKLDQLLVQRSYEEVVAPISGKIITEYKTLGADVNPGTPIFMVADFNELFCAITVPDRIAQNLSSDSTATFSFHPQNSSDFYDDSGRTLGMYINAERFSESATIFEILPPLSEASENRRIVWRFDNRSRILDPTIYGEVILKPPKLHNHLVIPIEALINVKNPVTFVINSEDDTAHMRPISIGITDNEYVEILSGLAEGELVITSVTEDLKDGSKVAVKEGK